MFGARENQHLRPVAFADQLRQQGTLTILADEINALFDRVDRSVATRDFDFHRLTQQRLRKTPDVFRVRRREQQILALRRQQLDDPANVGDESHVEHAIGFIEHQDLNGTEIHRALLGVIEQTTRRCHQDVGPAAQRFDLRIDAHATEDDQRAQLQIFAVGLDAFANLRRQLARRYQNQRSRRARAWTHGMQTLQKRQGESRRLTGSGLCTCEDVASGENFRDDAALDRRGFGVLAISKSPRQFGNQPKGGKRHGNFLRETAARRQRATGAERILVDPWTGLMRRAQSQEPRSRGGALYRVKRARAPPPSPRRAELGKCPAHCTYRSDPTPPHPGPS